jgi:hypothetical protein
MNDNVTIGKAASKQPCQVCIGGGEWKVVGEGGELEKWTKTRARGSTSLNQEREIEKVPIIEQATDAKKEVVADQKVVVQKKANAKKETNAKQGPTAVKKSNTKQESAVQSKPNIKKEVQRAPPKRKRDRDMERRDSAIDIESNATTSSTRGRKKACSLDKRVGKSNQAAGGAGKQILESRRIALMTGVVIELD